MANAYVAKQMAYWSREAYDRTVVITEVTDQRVKGRRHFDCGNPKDSTFDVKRNGDQFSVGSGSGKTRYRLLPADTIKE